MKHDGTETRMDGVALVLEGGGMRGIYTTGVLDGFLDNGIFFDYVIGVSAGASHALSYLSRQRDRARRVNVDYCRRRDYMGLGCLLREGSLFGMDLLFKKIPYALDPFDFPVFEKNAGSYYAVATSLSSGAPRYFAPRTADSVLDVAMASCSLPFVSKPIVIDGEPFLDGGIGDSIPVRKPLADGQKKIVVVLTQPRGYRKGPTSGKWLFRAFYGKYPEFVRALERRNESYNETLDYIDRLESEGTAFVIRPAPQPGLKRLERDPAVLNGLHRSGLADASANLAALKEFIA
jgi:predicted patatin/cPLA2 family phospholipase